MRRNSFWRENKLKFIVAGVVLLITFVVVYMAAAFFYRTHYMPKTCMNGISIGNMKLEDAEKKISREVSCYTLTVTDRDGNKYQILGPDFDYSYVSSGEADTILSEQGSFSWIAKVAKQKDYQLSLAIEYDKDKLEQLIDDMDCFDTENIVQPQNATIAETDEGYEIIPEVMGNDLKKDQVKSEILDAVAAGKTELAFSDDDYHAPEVYQDDASLSDRLAIINQYLDTTVKYDVGDDGEVLDRSSIKDFIKIDEDGQVTLDDNAITKYVQSLASKYNTYGDKRKFITSVGDTVEIGGGDYGWVIDKDAEKEQLLKDLKAGGTIEREPAFSQTAKVKSITNDIGNTYIEIDYTNQHLYYYENGEKKYDTDIVSGNITKGNGSPDGIFKIVYKQSPAKLVGEDYESDVQYFMPFAYNVGIHDADWRKGQFGGDIYKTKGSHGCINVLPEAAEALFGMVAKETPVVAYYREPVQLTAENTKIANAFSYVEPETNQDAGGEVPAATDGTTDGTTPSGDAAAPGAAVGQ